MMEEKGKNRRDTAVEEPVFHKPTFDRIDPEKRTRIIETAAEEFASRGFSAASINHIARICGISIGSLYSYFDSKENLFMTVVEHSREILIAALAEVQSDPGDFFTKMADMVRLLQKWTVRYQALNQIYIDLSTQGLKHLSARLSGRMESQTAEVYRRLLAQARAEGLVDPGLDEGMAIFCLDNIMMLTQFSYSSDFYRERMKIYAGEDIFEDPERVVRGIVDFLRFGMKNRVDRK
jgi:AcrR family transcriptional regulator